MINILDDSGLDDKFYQWKELITHSVLEPVLTITDFKHEFHIFGGVKTSELLIRYNDATLIKRLDRNYAKMLETQTAFLIQLINEKDIKLAQQKGYMHDAVFTVFKDDIIKANPATALASFITLDPKEYLQQNLN